jgi:hypothetical protein
MRSHALRCAALVAALMPCAGCFTTWDVPMKDVHYLDGYRAPVQQVATVTADGDEVVLDPGTQLHFQSGAEGPKLVAKFDAIDVHVSPGQWWIDGILHGDGQPVRVDLRHVTKISARRYSPGKTALAVAVPTVTVFLAAMIPLLVAVANIPHD